VSGCGEVFRACLRRIERPSCPRCPLPLGDGDRVHYGMHLTCLRRGER
jgi:hypothetical protein